MTHKKWGACDLPSVNKQTVRTGLSAPALPWCLVLELVERWRHRSVCPVPSRPSEEGDHSAGCSNTDSPGMTITTTGRSTPPTSWPRSPAWPPWRPSRENICPPWLEPVCPVCPRHPLPQPSLPLYRAQKVSSNTTQPSTSSSKMSAGKINFINIKI